MRNDYILLAATTGLFDDPAAAPTASASANETDSQTDMNLNTLAGEGLSAENKTYYDKELIRLAGPELIHAQFGQKRPVPRGGGNTIDFRRFDQLPEMTAPLEEGVTPAGQTIGASSVRAELHQYGGYVAYSDKVDLTAIDPVVLEYTRAIASQGGRSIDTVVREVLNGGTVVQYAAGQVASRGALHYTSPSDNCNLTVEAIKKAVRFLKAQNAPMIDGSYVAIIHPNVAYDLMSDPMWQAPNQYADPKNIFNGEIGKLYGVRFVENSRAKVWEGAGASGADVYSTLVLGGDAYGISELEGGGMETIIKPLGSAGTGDPLNQRGSVAWKATMAAERLVEQYMVRIETTATPN